MIVSVPCGFCCDIFKVLCSRSLAWVVRMTEHLRLHVSFTGHCRPCTHLYTCMSIIDSKLAKLISIFIVFFNDKNFDKN